MMKRVLVTGAGSYVGTSFETWVARHHGEEISVDTVGTEHDEWCEVDPSAYDVMFHVAGIAHADVVGADERTQALYYAVNRDLAIKVAKWAKEGGCGQFILMSTMIVYGDSAPCGEKRVVAASEEPRPASFYGDSKWQADIAIRALADEMFRVAVLRPPMIYGPGSKGNYPVLARLARRLPVFPDIQNERSMLYIGSLCELVCQIVLRGESGVFFPQDFEPHSTSEVVREVARSHGHRITITKALNWAPAIASRIPGRIGGLANKAFGSMSYEPAMSECGLDYRTMGLRRAIEEAEGTPTHPRRVLFLVNHDVVIYNFRLEIVERLLAEGYEVHVSSPYGERIDELVALGVTYHPIEMDRHSTNPLVEAGVVLAYDRLVREVLPDVVLGFTIKPNIYGAMAARRYDVPFVANITGLGTAVEEPGLSQKLTIALYKRAFRDVKRVFFQNEENMQFFHNHGLALNSGALLPGSGVNLERFPVRPYPEDDVTKFAFISRIMQEKGIDQYLEAAEVIRSRYDNVEFHVCGFCEPEYDGKLQELNNCDIIHYHGMIRDVARFMGSVHCIVHPTYYPEGISNVLLEACATARPIITTARPGCKEVVDDSVNGLVVHERDSSDLIDKIESFLCLSFVERKAMGLAGRAKVEREFDRQIVVNKYLSEIEITTA